MIEASILLVMEVEDSLNIANRKLVLVIKSRYRIIKVTLFNKAVDFLCKQAKVKQVGELAGKEVMLDADADFSCIYVIIKKKGRMRKLMPVSCDISLIKKLKKQ